MSIEEIKTDRIKIKRPSQKTQKEKESYFPARKKIIQQKLRKYKAERECNDGRGHTSVEVTDPSAEFFCSGNREPVPPGATGTESGLKVVAQGRRSGEEIKNKSRKPQAVERRKQARRVLRMTKRRAKRQKSRKAVQARVADTALPYERAQEVSDSVGSVRRKLWTRSIRKEQIVKRRPEESEVPQIKPGVVFR